MLGGEGNGGVIDPRVVLVRDSFVGMALLLDAMAERRLAVSQLAAELPRYEIVKTKVTLPREKIAAAFAAVERHFGDAKADRLDGLRLDWPGKWLLVRASNTEPIVRAIAEAPTAAEAERLCREAQAAMSHDLRPDFPRISALRASAKNFCHVLTFRKLKLRFSIAANSTLVRL